MPWVQPQKRPKKKKKKRVGPKALIGPQAQEPPKARGAAQKKTKKKKKKGEEKEKGIENVFEEIMAENFPNLEERDYQDIQAAQRAPNTLRQNRPIPI